jgi:hypothetical protein
VTGGVLREAGAAGRRVTTEYRGGLAALSHPLSTPEGERVAIAATWTIAGTAVTSSASLTTISNTGYKRDLVITNGGPSALYIGLGSGVTAATTINSFQIPSGGSLILSQCQVPQGAILYGVSAGTSATYVGFGSNVSYV